MSDLPNIENSDKRMLSEADIQSDIQYFKDKMKAAEAVGNAECVAQCKRRLAQMEDSVVIYRLGRVPDKTFT